MLMPMGPGTQCYCEKYLAVHRPFETNLGGMQLFPFVAKLAEQALGCSATNCPVSVKL
jgi:hypothetical protein